MNNQTAKKRVEKFVDIASRRSTHEGEALNALRKARDIADQQGQEIVEILRGTQGILPEDRDLSFDEYMSRMSLLEAALDKAEKSFKKVSGSYARLEASKDEAITRERARSAEKGRNADGTMNWGAFDTKSGAIFGKRHGVMAAIARHNEVPLTTVVSWRRKAVVPASAVEKLKSFRSHLDQKENSRIDWTFERDEEVAGLIDEHTDHEIVAMLEKRWQTTVALGAVKKARQRLRARSLCLRLFDNGMRDPEEINKVMVRELGKGFGGVSLKSVTDTLEHFRYGGRLLAAS